MNGWGWATVVVRTPRNMRLTALTTDLELLGSSLPSTPNALRAFLPRRLPFSAGQPGTALGPDGLARDVDLPAPDPPGERESPLVP